MTENTQYTDIYYNNNFGSAVLKTLNSTYDWNYIKKRYLMIFASAITFLVYMAISFVVLDGNNSYVHIFDIYLPLYSLTWLIAEVDGLSRVRKTLEKTNEYMIHRNDVNEPSLSEIWRQVSNGLYSNKSTMISYGIITFIGLGLVNLTNDDVSWNVFAVILLLNIFIYNGMLQMYILPKRVDFLKNVIYDVIQNKGGKYVNLTDIDMLLLMDKEGNLLSTEKDSYLKLYHHHRFFTSKPLGSIIIMGHEAFKHLQYQKHPAGKIFIGISDIVNPDMGYTDNITKFKVDSPGEAIALAYALLMKDGKYDEHNIWTISGSMLEINKIVKHAKRLHIVQIEDGTSYFEDTIEIQGIKFTKLNDVKETFYCNGEEKTVDVFKRTK